MRACVSVCRNQMKTRTENDDFAGYLHQAVILKQIIAVSDSKTTSGKTCLTKMSSLYTWKHPMMTSIVFQVYPQQTQKRATWKPPIKLHFLKLKVTDRPQRGFWSRNTLPFCTDKYVLYMLLSLAFISIRLLHLGLFGWGDQLVVALSLPHKAFAK